jgi:hypothetical protein
MGVGLVAASATLVSLHLSREVRDAWAWLERPRKLWRFEIVPASVLVEAAAAAVIAVVTVKMLGWDVVLGDRPVSQDHTTQFTKIWQTKQMLLGRGVLHGWSNTWFAGYPSNYLYPVGTDLWVILVYLLGMGLLSFGQAYAVAFGLFFFLGGYAVYRLGHRTFDRGIGLLASLMFLTDPGGGRSGGWSWAVEVGVWPNSLSMAFAVLALSRVGRIVRPGRWREVGMFGLLMGASLVTHPMQLLFFTLTLVVALATTLLLMDGEPRAGAAVRLAIAHVTGGLIGLAWFLPFLDCSDFVDRFGMWWLPGYDIGAAVVQGTLLEKTLAGLVWLGLFGMIACLWQRRFMPLAAAILAASILGVLGASFLDELHLVALLPKLEFVQFQRAVVFLKPLWFVFAGFAIVTVFRWIAGTGGGPVLEARARAPGGGAARIALAFVLGSLLAPVALGVWGEIRDRLVVHELELASDRPHREDRAALVAWMDANLPRDAFHRVGWSVGRASNELMDLATEIDRPMFKMYGGTPTVTYRYKLISASEEVLAAARVRYVIFDRKLDDGSYVLIRRFGDLYLHELRAWRPEPFDIVEGRGEVRVEMFEDEEIRLRAMPGAWGRLRLPVSDFPRWRAERDGHEVRITATGIAGQSHAGFMTVDLHPGLYRFRFERSAVDRAGAGLGLAGLVLAALLVLAGGVPRLSRWLDALEAPVARVLARRRVLAFAAAASFALAIPAVAWLASWTPAIEPGPGGGAQDEELPAIAAVRYDFLEHLEDAEVGLLDDEGYEACERLVDRFTCGKGPWRHVASRPTALEKYSTRRCISAHSHKGRKLVIRYRGVPAAGAIVGYFGAASKGRKTSGVELAIAVGGIELLRRRVQKNRKAHWFVVPLEPGPPELEVTFTVTAVEDEGRAFCFHAQAVDLDS